MSFRSLAAARRRHIVLALNLTGVLVCTAGIAPARSSPEAATALFPGGFVEKANSTDVRLLLPLAQIQSLVPVRGAFLFPPPYGTEGIRITNAADCGGSDCVDYVGYSYWRNINNHIASGTMLIVVGLNRSRGGAGPTLFSYDKTTQEVRNLGPLFDAASPFSWSTGEGLYWSASRPTTLYLLSGTRMLRYEVLSRQMETVFDAAPQFGSAIYVWQSHSSDDDRVHSATIRSTVTYEALGCLVYREDQGQFSFFPKRESFDECQVDRSGRWLLIKDNVDGLYGEDDRMIDLESGVETLQLDQNGAAGHSDNGQGYMVYSDNWHSLPNAIRVLQFGTNPALAPLVHHNIDWSVAAPNHVSHTNARPAVPLGQQFACGSAANRINSSRANEITCFRLDTSLDVLVVAPVMTDLNAQGGGDDYAKLPKGNLDVTGQYFIWTSNMGGDRLDAFVVKVPSHLLVEAAPDLLAPTVSLNAPAAGSVVSGTVTANAVATDDVGVAGVRFDLDGGPLGPEDTSAPYSSAWDTSRVADGLHTLTAVARDAAGHVTISGAVVVTVSNASVPAPGGLAGHWAFEEAGGATALDSSGSGNTGSLVGGPTRVEALIGKAVSFDGLDDTVLIPHTTLLNPYPLTVSAWFRTTTTSLTALVNKYLAASLNGYQLFMNGGSLCAWYFRDAANHICDQSGCTLSTPGFNDGGWHQAVLVVDASGGRLYVDGQLRAERAWTGTPGTTTTSQGVNLARYPGTATHHYAGLLDDVRIYSRAMSAAEVASLYTVPGSGAPGKRKPRR